MTIDGEKRGVNMDYNSILRDMKNNELKKVYLCYGKEIYLRDWILKELKNKYIDKALESLNYVYLDGKDCKVETIINACETLPFMSEKKLVIIENLPFFAGNRAGNSIEEGRIIEYLLQLNDSTCLIFIVNEEKIDNRKKLVKNIKSQGSVIQFSKIKGSELSKWVAKVFKKNNKAISKINIEYLIEGSGYLETNSQKTLYDLENEIIKICNYIGERTQVEKDDIDIVLARILQNNIFKLVDGIGHKNPEEALLILNEMILSNEPLQLILYMIIRQFRLMFMAKLLEQKGYDFSSIVQKMGVHRYIAKKALAQSRNFEEKELENALTKSLETDESIKKGNMDNRLAIETLIITIAK